MLGDKDVALLGCTRSEKAKEGFFMAVDIPNSPHRRLSSFQKVVDAFLADVDLPFADILSAVPTVVTLPSSPFQSAPCI